MGSSSSSSSSSSSITSSSSSSSSTSPTASPATKKTKTDSKSPQKPAWEWFADSGWQAYDQVTQDQLEENYTKVKRIALSKGYYASKPGLYEVDFSDPSYFYQENKQTGYQRQVQRYIPEPPPKLEEKKLDESIFIQLTKTEVGEEVCGICHSDFSEEEEGPAFKLNKCDGVHYFHKGCVGQWIKEKLQCPICKARYGIATGTQPTNGQMTVRKMTHSLPGYEGSGTIEISYNFPSGVQGPEHPSPGKRLPGTYRTAYLPDNDEGGEVLKLLQTAWQRRLVFTVGQSITRGVEGLVVWNGIHHKTSMDGGAENYGYPDPTYLTRVRDELKEKGVE